MEIVNTKDRLVMFGVVTDGTDKIGLLWGTEYGSEAELFKLRSPESELSLEAEVP